MLLIRLRLKMSVIIIIVQSNKSEVFKVLQSSRLLIIRHRGNKLMMKVLIRI